MRPFLLCSLAAATAIAACGDPFGPPDAGVENKVDTLVSLYAITGTPPATPSAYQLFFGQVPTGQVVRLDETTVLDFAFDIDTAGRAVLKPTGAIPLGRNSGLRVSPLAFDSIHIAPTSNYQLDSAVVVQVGDRVIVQSRFATCSWGGSAFYYAKLQVLAVDSAARRLDFRLLFNKNCGYRGLDLGVPRR